MFLLKLVPFLLAVVLFISCGEKEKSVTDKEAQNVVATFDTTDLQTKEVQNPDESFHLVYGFKKGEKYNYRLTVLSESQQRIEADTFFSRTINQSITYLLELNALEVEKDSTAELQCTFKSFKLDADAEGQKFNYQSGSEPDSADRMKYAEYLSFLDNPFNLRVSKSGQILDITRAEKISNKFLELRGVADSVKAEQKVLIKDDLVKNIIKPLMAQIIREYPDKKMAKDSSWQNTPNPFRLMVFQVLQVYTYKISSLEELNGNRLAVIDGTIESKIEGDPVYKENGVNYNFEKPVSTASAKIYFNLNTGLVQKSKTKNTLHSAYTMEMQTPTGLRKGKTIENVTNRNILELL